jgi:hypothetical protein
VIAMQQIAAAAHEARRKVLHHMAGTTHQPKETHIAKCCCRSATRPMPRSSDSTTRNTWLPCLPANMCSNRPAGQKEAWSMQQT